MKLKMSLKLYDSTLKKQINKKEGIKKPEYILHFSFDCDGEKQEIIHKNLKPLRGKIKCILT